MKERNYSIDVLKFVCAVLVVFLHTPWVYQQSVLPFTRCAVPCFFIISGYLLFDDGEKRAERLKKNFVHVGKITLWTSLLFIVWKEVYSLLAHGTIWFTSVRSLVNWLLFNNCPFGFHLWYLFAYLYVLFIVTWINQCNQWKLLYRAVPLLLLMDLAFGKYSLLLLGWEPPVYCVRNFIFVGLPYFTIGAIIKGNRLVIKDKLSRPPIKYCVWGGIILFTFTTYLERVFLVQLDKCAVRDHYLSSTFLAICMFLLTFTFHQKKPNWLSEMGKNDTLYIYVLHPIFLTVIPILFHKIHYYGIYLYFAPFLVFLSTVLFIFSVRRVNRIVS